MEEKKISRIRCFGMSDVKKLRLHPISSLPSGQFITPSQRCNVPMTRL